jgi:putative exosortase-associated protein (TIGR04073 family)
MRTFMLIAVAGLLAGNLPAQAASDDVVPGMGRKFVRGVVNTLTGVVELPVQTVKGYQSGLSFIKNKPLSKTVGTVLGFFRGIAHGAGRTGSGVVDVATFWAANHEDYKGVGVPLDAGYAWQQGTQYSVFKPNLKEGLKPFPRKLGRGLADGFLGVLEFPGQIYAGATSPQPMSGTALGVVKGFWFGLSRTATGLGDAILFIVPNPEDTKGYAYDQDWPWGGFTE